MKSVFKRVISLLLVVVMTVSILTACGNSNGGEEGEEVAAEITASSVKFLSSGKYTTTLEAKDVDLSKLSKDNVEVTYIGYDDGTVLAAATADEAEPTFNDYADGERFTTLESVTQNDNGTVDISFTDENAVKYGVSQYKVRLKDLETIVPVAVELPEMTITPDTTDITASTHEAKITLTLEGGEFADDPKVEYITLSNAFEKMSVDSISASGKNMTMLLIGDIMTTGKHGSFLFGTIGVAPEAVKDNAVSLRTNVNIITEFAGFDGSTFTYADGKVTVDLKAYDSVDLDALTEDNLKLEGVTVEKVEKKDDSTAAVTMTAKDIKSGNDFVKLVTGKKADFNGYEADVNLFEASFYPVFDYCEADGDNLKMTLISYVYNGTFNKELKPEAITLGNEFEGGKAESVTVAEDGASAEIIVSVPANGQKEDDFNIKGKVTLAKGSLNNAWNESNTEDVSYSRVYSNETLGKDWDFDDNWGSLVKFLRTDDSIDEMSINGKSLQAIQDWVRGKNTWFGSVLYWSNVGASVYSFGKMVLEMIGAVKSEHQQIMEQFQQIHETLARIEEKMEDQRKTLLNLETEAYRSGLESYEKDYNNLGNAIVAVEEVYKHAASDLAQQGLTISDDATEEEIQSYNSQLLTYIYKRADANGGRDPIYGEFDEDFQTLRNSFSAVAGYYLGSEGSNSPLERFDNLCALRYNFDTQAYQTRFLQRELLRAKLSEAIPLFAMRYEVSGDYSDLSPTSKFGQLYTQYQKAMSCLDQHEVQSKTPETVYFTSQEVEVDELVKNQFISDIMLVGTKNDTGCRDLDAAGYIPIGYDLNENAGGLYIYLGYKLTDNYDEAIKDFRIFIGGEHRVNSKTIDGINYSIAPTMGDKSFTDAKGDLNKGKKNSKDIFLFYTKDETPSKEAVTSITFNDKKADSIDGVDLNKGAGGDYIYMHVSKDPKGERYIRSLMLEAKEFDHTDVDYETEKSPFMNKYTVYPQNLNAGSGLCGGYHVYLGSETTDSYQDAVKDIKLVATSDPAESFEENGATYHLVDVTTWDGNFADSKGNLNYNSGSSSAALYMYYTKDAVKDKQAVTKISFDNDGTDAVSAMNLNYNVGGDVIYMHLEKQDQQKYRKVTRIVGNDPNYHPYSYVFGSTVSYTVLSDYSDKRKFEYENRALGFSAGRNWTDTEISKFCDRLHGKTIGQELESAGFPSDDETYLAAKITKIQCMVDGNSSSPRPMDDVIYMIEADAFSPKGTTIMRNTYLRKYETNAWYKEKKRDPLVDLRYAIFTLD